MDNTCKDSGLSRSACDATALYTSGTYLQNNQTWHVEDSVWKAREIIRLLNKNNLKPSTICEVGCGAGEILRQISQETEKVSCFGYELSPQAYQLCKTREGKKLQYFLKNILYEDVQYDSLLCIDVFEHVEDCFGLLRGLKSKAQYKVFHIPLDISVYAVIMGTMMFHRKNVGHIHYYTRETALATLEDCGYEILDEYYTIYSDYRPAQTLTGKLFQFLQRSLFKLSPHLAVHLLGGCSLLVLAK